MITYAWTIKDLSRREATGAVIEVSWQCVATDEYDGVTYTETMADISKYYPDVNSPDFVAYADLTESDVLSWLDTDSIEARLQVRLENAIGGKRASGLPW